MSAITIRNLPPETHWALKVRAARHGRSIEAEIRDILEAAVRPPDRIHLGTALAALGRRVGLSNEDIEGINQARDKRPAEPIKFD
jgi:plasmid stability protein